jgi:signal transduction histidine kinase
MDSWQVGAVVNGITAVAYLAIVVAIVRPLVQSGQLRQNRLGVATAAIFFTCAVHHGSHTLHLFGPSFGFEEEEGRAMRTAFTWHISSWDVLMAGVGVWYWTLRRTYAPLMHGAKLFEDMKERQRRALEINDDIVQGLTVAKLALELDDPDASREALAGTLVAAQGIISDLLGELGSPNRLAAGELIRSRPPDIGLDRS